ncbi:MAG TPA: hypothetical protein VFR24_26840 [Candidatus Angelobacter sp.]|nr:hypothetical protein [Candidatus Angelobacter sp.]
MSDAAGHFSISGVAAFRHLIMLEHSGFIDVIDLKNSPAANGVLALKPGDQLLNLALTFQDATVGRFLAESQL